MGGRSGIELGRFQPGNDEMFDSRERTKVMIKLVEICRLNPGPWDVIGKKCEGAWVRRDAFGVGGNGQRPPFQPSERVDCDEVEESPT